MKVIGSTEYLIERESLFRKTPEELVNTILHMEREIDCLEQELDDVKNHYEDALKDRKFLEHCVNLNQEGTDSIINNLDDTIRAIQDNDITQYIGSSDCFEIDYCKDDASMSILHISDIQPSQKYGNDYVTAICHESSSEITLKVSRIKHITKHWITIEDKNMEVPYSGFYAFICYGDNHLVYEMHRLSRGDSICKYFTGEYAHANGWVDVEPFAYHYVSLPRGLLYI